MNHPLLDVRDLGVRFATPEGIVHAVDRVSLSIDCGETLGIVGESGSGKSATSLALMGLVPSPPGIVEARSIMFAGRDLLRATPREWRALRGREIAMVFQDPMTSLNPLMRIGRQLGEVLELHERCTRRDARRRSAQALEDVGIADPETRLDAFPHEMSGGMRQRVMIAMALLCKPKLLLADEPTTALDVTIQAQILELLKTMQARHGTAIVLITHSLGVVAGAADRVLVMYAGRIVEAASVRDLFKRALHPYTHGLLRSAPRVDGDVAARLSAIPGQPPDLARSIPGCSFAPRCAFTHARCEREKPELEAALTRDERPVESRDARALRNDVPSESSRTMHVEACADLHRAACFVRDDLARIGERDARAPRASPSSTLERPIASESSP